MSYVARIAARATTQGTLLGGEGRPLGEPTPATASTSPLVEFDQRLTLPGFSQLATLDDAGERAEAPTTSAAAPVVGGETSSDSPNVPAPPLRSSVAATAAAVFRSAMPAASAPAPSAAPVAPSAAARETSPAAGMIPFGRDVRERAAFASRENPVTSSSTESLPALDPTPAPVGRAPTKARGVRVTADAALRPARAMPPSARRSEAASIARPANERAEALPTAVTTRDVEKPVAPPTPSGSLLDAMARLDAWIRTDAEPSVKPSEPLELAAPTTPALPAQAPLLVPAAYTSMPEAGADSPDTPWISIGKLEIEVVPPPAPRVVHAPAPRRLERAARASRAFEAPRPRAFGWRQR